MSRILTSGSQPALFLALILLCLLPGEAKGSGGGCMHYYTELLIVWLLIFCLPWRMCRELDGHALQDTHCFIV